MSEPAITEQAEHARMYWRKLPERSRLESTLMKLGGEICAGRMEAVADQAHNLEYVAGMNELQLEYLLKLPWPVFTEFVSALGERYAATSALPYLTQIILMKYRDLLYDEDGEMRYREGEDDEADGQLR